MCSNAAMLLTLKLDFDKPSHLICVLFFGTIKLGQLICKLLMATL